MNEPSPPLAEASDMQLVTTRFASLAPLLDRTTYEPRYRAAHHLCQQYYKAAAVCVASSYAYLL